ncbi:sensor histidine kinase [Parafrankia discariae]|uniref:sensor histidine kinase n=1 Tax=Parafrankia discariae TaxID=365528 RepID=UPI00037B6ED5|nr:sensor histidine kinase [Parafrankia discariae]
MPDHLSLAEPPGRLIANGPLRARGARGPDDTDGDEWLRRLPLWDVYFALVVVVALGFVLLGHGVPAARRGWGAGLVVLLWIGYLAVGRRMVRSGRGGWPALLYQLTVVVTFTSAAWLVTTSSVMLFALYAQAFLMVGAVAGVVTVLTLNLGWLGTVLLHERGSEEMANGPFPLPLALLSLVLSIVIGVWAHHIIRQSSDRAALIRELETTRAELGRLSFQSGQAAEREHYADAIHDTLAQGLASVLMLMQALDAALDTEPARARRHLTLAQRATRQNLADARALIAARPAAETGPASLTDALRTELDRLRETHEVHGTLRVEGPPRPLGTALDVVLLRGGQEALANVAKHAAASEVTVTLRYHDDRVSLEVHDDGRGFAGDATSPGHGLPMLHRRVCQAGGRLTVTSTPGDGTTVRLEVSAP